MTAGWKHYALATSPCGVATIIDAAKNTRMMDDYVELMATDPEFEALTSMVYTETHWETMKFESNWSEE
jgi:hypothetical protein